VQLFIATTHNILNAMLGDEYTTPFDITHPSPKGSLLASFSFLCFASIQALDTKLHLSADISLISKLAALAKAQGRYRTLDDAGSFTVADLWEETFSAHPDKPCIIFSEDGSSITYGEVDKCVLSSLPSYSFLCVFHLFVCPCFLLFGHPTIL
jgi:hypothetical protein